MSILADRLAGRTAIITGGASRLGCTVADFSTDGRRPFSALNASRIYRIGPDV